MLHFILNTFCRISSNFSESYLAKHNACFKMIIYYEFMQK